MSAVRLALATLALLIIGTTAASAAPLAATRDVTIQNFAFAPATISVSVGDSVKWTNQDGTLHSAKAADNSWNTTTLSQGQSGIVPFTTAGSYAYVCGIHGASMSGTVVVQAAATPATTTPPPTGTIIPIPTVTPVRTPAPTVAPTPLASAAPTSAASASPSLSPTPTLAPTTSAPVAVVSTAPSAPPQPAVTGDAGPGPLLVVIGAIVIVGLLGLAFVLSRR